MIGNLNRRELLASAATLCATGAVVSAAQPHSVAPSTDPFQYCLNTATLMGHKLDAVQEVEVAAQAGYTAIEPWVQKVREYVEAGHQAKDLGKRIADLGLSVESAIGFAAWAVEDATQREKELDRFKRDMELITQIGGKRIAAPPAGINRIANVDLNQVADRYRVVLELARQMGLVAELEIWGSALSLARMSEAVYVAVQADHPDACLLLDVYHLFRGGSGFHGLKLIAGSAMHVFHMNDYPGQPEREKMTDADRVYPGDGVAPFEQILGDLARNGFRGFLSLELFNREYWQQDALHVARTGLEKMRSLVRRALAAKESVESRK